MNDLANKETIRAIVVDDEALARRGLSLRLAAFPDVAVVAECANGREALQTVAQGDVDLMFLDIQMPGLGGFDVVARLQQDNLPLVVFVTAYDQYAIDAFEVHAIDYLLKPINEARLAEAVGQARLHRRLASAERDKSRLLEMVMRLTGSDGGTVEEVAGRPAEGAFREKIPIKDRGDTTLVPVAEIDWVDAAGDYMCIHAAGETHVMRITMKQLEAMLDPARFQRVHRSTIVNLGKVSKVCSHMNGEYHLVLDCGAMVKMSRSYRDKVSHFL